MCAVRLRNQDVSPIDNDDEVLNSDNGNPGPIALDKYIAAFNQLRLPANRVALAVPLPCGMQRLPIANIRPRHVGPHHRRPERVLHDRVIDRFRLDLGERSGVWMKAATVRVPE